MMEAYRRFNNYIENEDVSYEEKAFSVVMVYTLSAILVASVLVAFSDVMRSLLVILLSFALAVITLIYIFFRFGNRVQVAIVFCYLLNFIFLPLLYFFEGGLTGGAEFLFIAGIIDVFILMAGTARTISMLVFIGWYVLIIVICMFNDSLVQNIPSGMDMMLSNSYAIVFCIGIFLVMTGFQNTILKRQRHIVREAMESCNVSSRTKSRFLANMSHELRTPMNAIIGMADYMKKADDSGDVEDELEVIRSTAENLLEIVEDILVYSKLDSGKLEMMYEQFYFDKLITDIIRDAQDAAMKKGTELEVELDPNMPYVLYGDDIKISRILKTLLMSAVENTENGRVTMSISGKKNRDGTKIRLTGRITDTGEGLSKDDMETIYTGFETYDSKKGSRIKILGLELTICKGILEMMNGSLLYESIKDVGSSASFDLDCFVADFDKLVDTSGMGVSRVLVAGGSEWERKVWGSRLNEFKTVVDYAVDEAEFVMETGQTGYSYFFIEASMYEELKKYIDEKTADKTYIICDGRHRFGDFGKCRVIRKPVTVMNLGEIFCDRWNEKESESAEDVGSFVCRDTVALVVDDNRVNLKVAEMLLESYRARVIAVDSGFAALSVLRKTRPDLVFMDQVMPGIGGVETMQEIRYDKRNSGIPIICMTADMDDDIKENLIGNGFDDYLPKPIKDRQLEKILLDYLPNNKIVYKGFSIKNGRRGDEAE